MTFGMPIAWYLFGYLNEKAEYLNKSSFIFVLVYTELTGKVLQLDLKPVKMIPEEIQQRKL